MGTAGRVEVSRVLEGGKELFLGEGGQGIVLAIYTDRLPRYNKALREMWPQSEAGRAGGVVGELPHQDDMLHLKQ